MFPIGLTIQVLEKKFAIASISKPTLPNIFKSFITITQEPIEQLSSMENSIIIITKSKMLNIKANNREADLTVFRMYKLIDSSDKIFFLQTQWAPESDSAIEVWEELKKMVDSFSII